MQANAAVSASAQALRDAILKATQGSLGARDLYTEKTVKGLSDALARGQQDVAKAVIGYKGLSPLPERKLAALRGLGELDRQIAAIMGQVQKEQTLRFRGAYKDSYQAGAYDTIDSLVKAQLPFYKDLKPKQIDKLATNVFQIVDTDALDFSANYALQLAGQVNDETKTGISRVIRQGLATGKGPADIVRDMGEVVTDTESFRKAGGRVFPSAQNRMELIARTEIIRAHNQGKMKFHEAAGITVVEWMTMEDERMCNQCGALDGKPFLLSKLPNQPLHPNCRCTHIPAWPLVICGAGTLAEPLPTDSPSLLVPELPGIPKTVTAPSPKPGVNSSVVVNDDGTMFVEGIKVSRGRAATQQELDQHGKTIVLGEGDMLPEDKYEAFASLVRDFKAKSPILPEEIVYFGDAKNIGGYDLDIPMRYVGKGKIGVTNRVFSPPDSYSRDEFDGWAGMMAHETGHGVEDVMLTEDERTAWQQLFSKAKKDLDVETDKWVASGYDGDGPSLKLFPSNGSMTGWVEDFCETYRMHAGFVGADNGIISAERSALMKKILARTKALKPAVAQEVSAVAPSYSPFKNAKQAASWAKERHPDIDWSGIENMSEDTADAVAGQMDYLLTKYPQVKQKLKTVAFTGTDEYRTYSDSPLSPITGNASSFGVPTAIVAFDGHGIYFSNNYAKESKEKFEELFKWADEFDRHEFNGIPDMTIIPHDCTSLEYIVTHEFGHVMHMSIGSNKSQAFINAHKDAVKSVSEYANENWMEGFAESFAALEHSKHDYAIKAPLQDYIAKELF